MCGHYPTACAVGLHRPRTGRYPLFLPERATVDRPCCAVDAATCRVLHFNELNHLSAGYPAFSQFYQHLFYFHFPCISAVLLWPPPASDRSLLSAAQLFHTCGFLSAMPAAGRELPNPRGTSAHCDRADGRSFVKAAISSRRGLRYSSSCARLSMPCSERKRICSTYRSSFRMSCRTAKL